MRALTVAPGVANSAHVEDLRGPPPANRTVAVVCSLAVGVGGTEGEIVSGLYGGAPRCEKWLAIGHVSLGCVVVQSPAGCGLNIGDPVVGIVQRLDPVPCPASAVGEWHVCRNSRYTERGIKERNGFGADSFRIEPEFLDSALGPESVLVEPTSAAAKGWDHTYYQDAVAVLQQAGWLGRVITRRVGAERWTQALATEPDDIKKVVVDFS